MTPGTNEPVSARMKSDSSEYNETMLQCTGEEKKAGGCRLLVLKNTSYEIERTMRQPLPDAKDETKCCCCCCSFPGIWCSTNEKDQKLKCKKQWWFWWTHTEVTLLRQRVVRALYSAPNYQHLPTWSDNCVQWSHQEDRRRGKTAKERRKKVASAFSFSSSWWHWKWSGGQLAAPSWELIKRNNSETEASIYLATLFS